MANTVDPDQTAPIAVCFGSTLFANEASQTFQQTRKADHFCCDWCIKGLVLEPNYLDKKSTLKKQSQIVLKEKQCEHRLNVFAYFLQRIIYGN